MRDFEELEADTLAGLNLEEGEEMEDYEDFEDFEDLEDFEDFEDFEDGEGSLEAALWESGEADPFLGNALKRIRKAVPGVLSNPLVKRMARLGAGALGQAIGGKQGARLAGMVANQVLREESLEGDFEDFEDESDFEADFEAVGGDLETLYEMQYYADRVATAESQDEADQFIPIIAGLASKLLPKALPLVGRGIRALGSAFGRSRAARPMLRTLPRMAAQAATRLARTRATPTRVINTMSRQLGRTMATPRRLATAIRRPLPGRPLPGRPMPGRPMPGRPMPGRRPGYMRRPGFPQRPRYAPRPGFAPQPGLAAPSSLPTQPFMGPRAGLATQAGLGVPGYGPRRGYGRRRGSIGRRRILAPVYAVVRF